MLKFVLSVMVCSASLLMPAKVVHLVSRKRIAAGSDCCGIASE